MHWSLSRTRRAFLFLLGGILAKLGIACNSRNGSKDEPLSAADILNRMATAYANCRTYQDSGCVTTVFMNADGQRIDKRPFSTAFVRPGRFRFAFKSSHDGRTWHRLIVWADGPNVRTWWDIQPEVKVQSSLAMALAGATGVSGASAHTISALLMPESISGRRLTDLTELKRLADSQFAGADCFRIQGRFVVNVEPAQRERLRQEMMKVTGREPESSTSGPTTLSIDKSRFLLVQIKEQTQFDSF